jgi:LytS/YehU family sensor histidine kinase
MLITKNSEQASAYLHKLSDMMRFMLYETHEQRMPLSKELEYIDKYISLQKIRYSNPNFVEFNSQTSYNHLLPPMLFIPFIENAFKFAKPMKDKPGIHIAIAEQAEELLFTCTNTIDPEKVKSTSNGLGNKLMKRRLELLFPGKHLLTTSHTPISYEVSLHIQLS